MNYLEKAYNYLISNEFRVVKINFEKSIIWTLFRNRFFVFALDHGLGIDNEVKNEVDLITNRLSGLSGIIQISQNGTVEINTEVKLDEIDFNELLDISEWEKQDIGSAVAAESLEKAGYKTINRLSELDMLPQIICENKSGKLFNFLVETFYYGASKTLTHFPAELFLSYTSHLRKDGISYGFIRLTIVSEDNPFDPRFVDIGEKNFVLKRGKSIIPKIEYYDIEIDGTSVVLINKSTGQRFHCN